jgi:hypothetical protein
VLGEPLGREVGDRFEFSLTLEQVAGPLDNRKFLPTGEASASRLCSSTSVSAPPTTNSVGASTDGNAADARSTRPPRETTTPMSSRSAAARNAAAAPVLDPK